jgi:hypothetical protein
MKVQIEFKFDSLELLVGIKAFLKYPHKFHHCMLVIMQFHIVNDMWIEKNTIIMEVTKNQGLSLFEGNLYKIYKMAWHVERMLSKPPRSDARPS